MAVVTFQTKVGNKPGAKAFIWLGQRLVRVGLFLIEEGCVVRWELKGRGGRRGEFHPTIVASFHAEGVAENDPLAEKELN